MVQFGREQAVTTAMPRQETDLAAGESTPDDGVGRRAERQAGQGWGGAWAGI
jgi:hypothetical protein